MAGFLKMVAAWVVLVIMGFAFSTLVAFAITAESNPINKGWAIYACGNLMTAEEAANEPRCD